MVVVKEGSGKDGELKETGLEDLSALEEEGGGCVEACDEGDDMMAGR